MVACKYVARPPLAVGRLTQVSDDLLSFQLKTPWSDGTTAILLSPLELVEKISARVPPPRRNLVRYHGILAPHAKQREKVVPASSDSEADSGEPIPTRRNYRLSWAALLARTFGLKLTRHLQRPTRLQMSQVFTIHLRQNLPKTLQLTTHNSRLITRSSARRFEAELR